ncbi:MAG TPA: hypothetical protein VMW63_06330 [Methanoregulaceae archaeon]|nr:hypothetical protein [Methanoregulaceae archaeon]
MSWFYRFCGVLFILCLFGAVLQATAFTDPCPTDAQNELTQLYINAIQSRGDEGSCDAYCKQQYALLERRSCEYAVSGYCYDCNPTICSKYGISCGSGGTGSDTTPPGDDNTWIVIVGALVIIGGGLAVGAKVLGKSKEKGTEPVTPGKKKEKKEKEQVRYILQLSADHLTVTKDAPAHLTVTAWKISGNTPPAPAPEAALTLTVPADDKGLSVQPASGNGSVTSGVSLVSQVSKNPVTITVTASAGKSSVSAQVTVEIPADYVIEFF